MGPFPMLSTKTEMPRNDQVFRDQQKISRGNLLPQRLIRHDAPYRWRDLLQDPSAHEPTTQGIIRAIATAPWQSLGHEGDGKGQTQR
jgi:hypothetical protein